jgi:hypothetical protein
VPGKIFISYRRGDDPGTTGRLFDALKDTFDADRLFLDVDNIEPGLDFIEVIEDRISKSDVLLAVIGEHWIEARDREGRRRLDSPQDSVRIEIESAINQKKRVIPVLIGETKIPEPDLLPESLRVLARRNAATIRHERFHDDMANLTKALRRAPGVKPDWCSEDHLKQDELTICATQSLWALDNQLNDVFRKYSATVSDPKALSDDEAKWVREIRRPCAADQQCITKVYLARIATFNVFLLRQ